MIRPQCFAALSRQIRSMSKQIVATDKAPGALGPYSQAVSVGGGGRTVYVSGQLGLEPGSTSLVEGVEAQTALALSNMSEVLKAAGGGMPNVVKTTVLLKDLADFDKVNAVYAKSFPGEPPARACFQVARLPKDGLVEIEAVAFIP